MTTAEVLGPIAHRLGPGVDLRAALDEFRFPDGSCSGFVIAGLGSLSDPVIRFAAAVDGTVVPGPVEIIAMSGSLSADGAHVHVCVSDAQGRVFGGHLCPGSVVRTTVELMVAKVPGVQLRRQFDPVTGYLELSVRPLPAQPLR